MYAYVAMPFTVSPAHTFCWFFYVILAGVLAVIRQKATLDIRVRADPESRQPVLNYVAMRVLFLWGFFIFF